jgi:hypothetical protein
MLKKIRPVVWIAFTAIALLLTACGGTPRAAARPSPTAPEGTKLAWRQVPLPAGADLQYDGGFAASPVDGRDAWVCAPASANGFTIWATQDAGASWQHAGTFAPATLEPARSCTLVADEVDPRSLVAVFSWGAGADGTLRAISYVSTDGGAQWRRLQGEVQTMEIGSVGGKTYAILADTSAGPSAQPPPELVVSTDGLRSWRVIRPAGLGSRDGFFRFSISPSTGELMSVTSQNTLWRTADAGASWSQVAPTMQLGLPTWLSQQGHWLVCWGTGAPTSPFRCSMDLGQTWVLRPIFDYTIHCDTCGKGGSSYTDTEPCLPDVIAPDGSLLAVCPTSGNAPNQGAFTAYRLAPGAPEWSSLGSAPATGITVPATGPIWCLDTQGTVAVATLPF